MKRFLIVIVVIAALGVGGWYYLGHDKPTPAPPNQLRVSGNIEVHQSIVSFKVPGRLIDLPVEEGQFVKKGQVLARLDDEDYRRGAQADKANLRALEAQLRKFEAGSRPQEIAAAEKAVEEARADLANKRIEYERMEGLYKDGVMSRQVRDNAEAAFKVAQARLARLEEEYRLALEGFRREDIEMARAQVRQAKEALELARIKLGYTVLRAPVSGVILVRNTELGEVLAPGTPVVNLALLDQVWLRAYIPETELGRVRWGQDVEVTTDTYPGKRYHGRVSFISSQAEFTPKSVQTFKERVTLVYRIKIDIDNPSYELKPGMPADAIIALAPKP